MFFKCFPKILTKTVVSESSFQKNCRIKPATLSKTHLYCYSTINVTTVVFISVILVEDCKQANKSNTCNEDLYKYPYLILTKYFCKILSNLNEFAAGQISHILTNTIEVSLGWHVSGLSIVLNTNQMCDFSNSELEP